MGMQVALWIGTVVVFSLAKVGMILAWVMAGTLLRLAQVASVTGTRFVRVRARARREEAPGADDSPPLPEAGARAARGDG
jgi:hypothetical protein